jgi:hypothetical protein
MFNVEKDLVDYGASDKELEEKKQEIEKEYVLYSKIADIILSQEERKFWNALTT